jgi:farnesyl diphosphate synthase
MKITDAETKAIKTWVARAARATDDVLADILPRSGTGLAEDPLWECMRYAVFSGGKRLRPALLFAGHRLAGGEGDAGAARAAAALEMIHIYSLIQDDLPCMDDDDLRHGKPCAHKAFNEATALLASDGLLTAAFEVLAGADTHPDAEIRCELVRLYAAAAGALGMVGGQMADMVWEWQKTKVSAHDLARLNGLKTGALIHAGALAGVILAGGEADARRAVATYAGALGRAYQIHNDVLDATGEAKTLGKTPGRDAARDKRTFVTMLGLAEAKKQAEAETEAALEAVADYGAEAEPLRLLARFAVTRSQ